MPRKTLASSGIQQSLSSPDLLSEQSCFVFWMQFASFQYFYVFLDSFFHWTWLSPVAPVISIGKKKIINDAPVLNWWILNSLTFDVLLRILLFLLFMMILTPETANSENVLGHYLGRTAMYPEHSRCFLFVFCFLMNHMIVSQRCFCLYL